MSNHLSNTAAFDITQITVDAEPSAATTTDSGSIQYTPPAPVRLSANEAREAVLAGLAARLRTISQSPETATEQLDLLAQGCSLTGTLLDPTTSQPINTIEGLRQVISSLTQLQWQQQLANGHLLLVFNLPNRYQAYSGEEPFTAVLKHYHRKDQRQQATHEASKAAAVKATERGLTPPPVTAPVNLTKIEPTGSSWGPWAALFLKGLEVDSVVGKNPVNNQMQNFPTLISRNSPRFRTRRITFILGADQTLLTWQVGRYTAEMTPASRVQMVLMANDETTNEELNYA